MATVVMVIMHSRDPDLNREHESRPSYIRLASVSPSSQPLQSYCVWFWGVIAFLARLRLYCGWHDTVYETFFYCRPQMSLFTGLTACPTICAVCAQYRLNPQVDTLYGLQCKYVLFVGSCPSHFDLCPPFQRSKATATWLLHGLFQVGWFIWTKVWEKFPVYALAPPPRQPAHDSRMRAVNAGWIDIWSASKWAI